MITLLGIDPGSRFTGYGIIESQGNHLRHITSGTIKLGDGDYPERLRRIYTELETVIKTYVPIEAAIEKVFMNKNADSALKLGQARGVAMVACSLQELPLSEYSANHIKQSLVGRGHATKAQIQHMVKVLLNLRETPPTDAADALAIAICHAHHRQNRQRMASVEQNS